MMYSLNKSTFIRVRKNTSKWPYANQVIDQVRGVLTVRKESYCLGFWISAMEDLQLTAILDALNQVQTIPHLDLDQSSPHVAGEVADIVISILIGLSAEYRTVDISLNPDHMAAHLKSFHEACILEKLTRQGTCYQFGYYRACSKNTSNYRLVNSIEG